MSRQEMRDANVEKMGEALGEVYSELWQEVSRTFGKWEEYVELFGAKESRIDLMNQAASDFFGRLQGAGFREVLLDIACLTDSPRSMGRENLSVRAVPELIDDLVLRQRVLDLIDVALEKSAFARDWRNRHLAHRDRALALGKAEPLPPATREMIAAALSSLGAVLNELQHHFFDSVTAYDLRVSPLRGVQRLLYILDEGVRADKARLARYRAGDYQPGDEPRDV